MDSDGTGTRFSVVIVNYNGGTMLQECVLSTTDEGVPMERIVVVDNGSHDDSIAELQKMFGGTQVILNQCNAGFARAVNQGIKRAGAEFILLLNNDAQLGAGALQAFAEGFDARPNLAIAGGQLRFPDGRLQNAFAPLPSLAEEFLPLALLRWIAPERYRRRVLATEAMKVESVLGACLCVRSSLLPQLGLLDEDFFFFFEEIEWCQRAGKMGMEVCYLPQAQAIHKQGHTANRFRGPARVEYQRSKLTYFKKSLGTAAFLAASGYMVFRTLANAVSGSVMCAATLFLKQRLRLNTRTYWYLVCWHFAGRPASWGLPGKCTKIDDRM